MNTCGEAFLQFIMLFLVLLLFYKPTAANLMICTQSNRIIIAVCMAGIFALLPFKDILAQQTSADEVYYANVISNAKAVYHSYFADQSALYNGSKYNEYKFKFKEGHPFFYSDTAAYGSVVYDGILYDSVLMRYDETKDALVINDQGNRIHLISEKIGYFKIFSNDFIRLKKDSISNKFLQSGFYNVLYKGNISLLKKEIKIVKEEIFNNSELIRNIEQKDYYFIIKGSNIFSINSSKDLYNLTGDKKKEVQQFARAGKLRFKKNTQNMLTKVVAYFDSLNK
jgi:hypothetical protein